MMRSTLALLAAALVAGPAFGQTAEIQEAIDAGVKELKTAKPAADVPPALGRDAEVADLVNRLDKHFDTFWADNKVKPAAVADDAEFLRRLSLDLIGRIPTPAEVRAFLADKAADKRAKKIDELIAKPSYVAHLAGVLRRQWLPQTLDNPQFQFTGPTFETWLRKRLKANAPYDVIVRDMVTVPTQFNRGRVPAGFDQTDSPFVFNQVNEFKPENVAAAVSRLFMGVKVECAQCHNHPFAPIKREQFWETAAFFAEINPTIANLSDAKLKRRIKISDGDKTVEAKFFDGTSPMWGPDQSPRETFAAWLTAETNPYFAKNAVNRVWAMFFGVGFIDPIDEPGDENPPTVPEAYEELTKAFVAGGYDLRLLMRAVARSKPYQLSSKRSDKSQDAGRTFARMAVKGMSAEQLFDSLALATGYVEANRENARRFGGFGTPRAEFVAKFASTEKATEKQTTILQALTLMNGKVVTDQTSLERSQYLAAVADAPFLDTAGRVEALFLASVGRKPTASEAEKFGSYVDRGGLDGDKAKALTDVFWALLNASEFSVNH